MIVLWGEDYEQACKRIDSRLHEELADTRAILSAKPDLGIQLIDGSQFFEITMPVFVGLMTVRVAYTIESPYVILWDAQLED